MEPKHISQLMPSEGTSYTTRPTDKSHKKLPSLSQKWISAIFEKLARRYAYAWHAMVGETQYDIKASMREWGEVLHDLTAEEIQMGFNRLDTEAPKRPPGVMDFKNLCKTEKPAAAHRQYKALPKPKSDPGVAQAHIQKMREALRGK